jgi:membrane protease subunit HflK
VSLLHLSPNAEPLLPAPPAVRGGARRRWRQVGLALAGLWMGTGIYVVRADEQAVVTRFGRLVEGRVQPGLHYALPWPVEEVTRVKVRQLRRLVVGAGSAAAGEGASQGLSSQFLTGDQNIIQLRVAVQYSASAPAEFLFQTLDVGQTVGAVVEAELARRIARQTVDAVLTTEKVAIEGAVRAAAQRRLEGYGAGVAIASVSIESATPPPEAVDAFNDVASARADAARIVNEAQGYANDVIPRARGEAQQLLEAAHSYRLRKINEATGDAARFTQLAGEYSRAAEVNGRRLYAEAMEEILPRIKKLIVDSRGKLDLTILRRGEAKAGESPKQ